MIVKSIKYLMYILILYSFIFAQEYTTTTTTEESGEVVQIESQPTYENITTNDITKKEEEILNQIAQINENIIKANTSNSLKMKKTIMLNVDEMKLNLKKLTKEYAAMIKAYNERIATADGYSPSEPSPTVENISEIQLENYKKELKRITEQINEKVAAANSEFTNEGRKKYIPQIEQLKNEYLNKKLKYIKLVQQYNKKIEESLKLNGEINTNQLQ